MTSESSGHQQPTSPLAAPTTISNTGRMPDPLPSDPEAAEKLLVSAIAQYLDPLLKNFGKPYQLAQIGYSPPEDDVAYENGWRNIDVMLGWYYCSPTEARKLVAIFQRLGYHKEDKLLPDVYGGVLGDLYVQISSAKGGNNCSLSLTTPVVKVKFSNQGSRTLLDSYLGKYKDTHADPNYYMDTKPPHPASYYGTPRG